MNAGKVCTLCKKFKEYSQFSSCNDAKDGKQYRCKECRRLSWITKESPNYTEIDGETWKPLVGYEGYYSVSDLGRVRSESREITKTNGSTYLAQKRILVTYKNKKGYLTCCISKGGSNTAPLVHRLEAISFLPNPDKLPEVNHINGIKEDNRLVNLEWCSGKQNVTHAIRIGLIKPRLGKDSAHKKAVINTLTKEVFHTLKEAAESVNISPENLSNKLNLRAKNNTNLKFVCGK